MLAIYTIQHTITIHFESTTSVADVCVCACNRENRKKQIGSAGASVIPSLSLIYSYIEPCEYACDARGNKSKQREKNGFC